MADRITYTTEEVQYILDNAFKLIEIVPTNETIEYIKSNIDELANNIDNIGKVDCDVLLEKINYLLEKDKILQFHNDKKLAIRKVNFFNMEKAGLTYRQKDISNIKYAIREHYNLMRW